MRETFIERLRNFPGVKYSFGKNFDYNIIFSEQINSFNMHTPGFGIGVPSGIATVNKINAIFVGVMQADGIFTFNISTVDIRRAMIGFHDFEEASGNNMVTEWELFTIFSNEDYFKKTIFHNGANEFLISKRGIKIKWN